VQIKIIFPSAKIIHDKTLINGGSECYKNQHNSSFWPGHCLHFSSSYWYPLSHSHELFILHVEYSAQSEFPLHCKGSEKTKETLNTFSILSLHCQQNLML
jgi:hypothetical protein